MFRLYKEEGIHILEFQDIIFHHSFDIYPVTTAHAGTYKCQGFDPNYPYGFSEISDPLLIIVTGETIHVGGVLHCPIIPMEILSPQNIAGTS